jgi:hypothetical protein
VKVVVHVMADLATSNRSGNVGFTEAAASVALTHACQRAGLDCGEPTLIRMGSNAVFRVDGLIARIAPSPGMRENVRKQIAVARWLESVGYPATRAAHIPQPIEADERIVTFWESVSHETVYAPIAEVAALIRRLHTLVAPENLSLPPLQPFGAASDPLPCFSGLSPEDERYLRRRLEWARDSFPRLPFALPPGVIHGDANVGNVLVDDHGQAVLIDLDSFAVGPREWDLIQTALFFDRLGWHTGDEYREFAKVYGYDITEWAGYSALVDMREIAMTSWVSKKAANSRDAAVEAAKRIKAIRTGASRRDWGAY